MRTVLLNSLSERDPVELIYLVTLLATMLIIRYFGKRNKDNNKES